MQASFIFVHDPAALRADRHPSTGGLGGAGFPAARNPAPRDRVRASGFATRPQKARPVPTLAPPRRARDRSRNARSNRFAYACLLLATVLAGCGGGNGADAPEVVEGRIVEIAYDGGLTRSFTLETPDGESYKLSIDDNVNYGFGLGHLEEHRTGGQPVRCRVLARDDRLVALTIEDA